MRTIWMAAGVVAAMWGAGMCRGSETGTVGQAAANVVVTATRTAVQPEDTPAMVDRLDAAAIRELAPVQVDELFRGQATIDLQGGGLPGSEVKFNMRGLTPGYQSKRVLVLRDGRRLNEQYQGNVEFSLLPADGIERIELVRGPGSALYGSGAMGGVLQVFSRTGRDLAAGERTGVRVAGGTYDTRTVQAWHGGAAGAWDWFVTGSGFDTAGYLQTAQGRPQDWTAASGQANVGWQAAEDVAVRAYTGFLSGEGQGASSYRRAWKDYQQADLRWSWDPAREADLLVRAYRNGDRHSYDWPYPGKGIYEQETLASEVQQSVWAGDRHRLTAGLEVRREAVAIDEVQQSIDRAEETLGVYVQDEWLASRTLRLQGGVRYDRTEAFQAFWSPRLAAVWRPVRPLDVYASVNRAHRAPGLSDRYVYTEYAGAVFEGNPDLGPESLTAWETGIRWRPTAGVALGVAGFFNTLEDSFDFTRSPDGVFRVRNVTSSQAAGIEADATVRLGAGLSLEGSYSYTDGEYDEADAIGATGRQLAYLAPHKAALGMRAAWGRVSQLVRVRYVSERFGDARNTASQVMGDYCALDWRLRVHLGGHVDLTVNVDNLLDESYEEFPGVEQPGTVVMTGIEARW